ncbi:MAG: hypothetical protein QOI04_1688 [Verrucomicrobiota bacterium]|jgi:hypothetical protein
MFPLRTKTLPASAAELSDLIEKSLREVVEASANFVRVSDRAYPELEEIRVTLDGATLRMPPPKPPKPVGSSSPALHANRIAFSGKEMSIQGAQLNVVFDASNVELHESREVNGDIVLVLQRAADGKIDINISKRDLEDVLTALARAEASKRGVAIEHVDLVLETRGPRSIGAVVNVAVRKAFFSAKIKIAGHLDIDDQLLAKLSNLSCKGEGAIGSLACGVLTPILQRANNRSFSLIALPMGEVQLRDVQIAAGDQISVQARFGSRA